MIIDKIDSPDFRRLVSATLAGWPEHQRFMAKSFEAHTEGDIPDLIALANKISSLAGNEVDRFVTGYRWMCEAFVEEEIYFRRNGEYRCHSFQDAYDAVYGNAQIMALYMDGLLLSQLFWSAHTKGFLYFKNSFLSRLPLGYRLLEIGCGHGLLLAEAAADPRSSGVEGWDVSAESLRHARETLTHFGCIDKARFEQADLFANNEPGEFDALALSELLEHLEDPVNALTTLRAQLKPNGLVYVNIPVNSPAPDHIYLWRSLKEVEDFVVGCGFQIVDSQQAPMSGYSLERALALGASINCLVTAQRT